MLLPHPARIAPSSPRQAALARVDDTPASDRCAVGVATLAPDLRVLAGNAPFFGYFGGSSAELCGRTMLDLLDLLCLSSPSVLREHLLRLRDERSSRFTRRVVGYRSDRRSFSGELTAIAVQGPSHRLSAIIVLVEPDKPGTEDDATARRRILLSPLEAQILEALAMGKSTAHIAATLCLSRNGVQYHVGSMARKLNVPNDSALVSRAYSVGMLTVDTWPARVPSGFVK